MVKITEKDINKCFITREGSMFVITDVDAEFDVDTPVIADSVAGNCQIYLTLDGFANKDKRGSGSDFYRWATNINDLLSRNSTNNNLKQKVKKQRDVIGILKPKLQEARDKIEKAEHINKQLNSEIKSLKDEAKKKSDKNYSHFETGIFTGITLVFAVVGFVSTLVFLFK